MIICKDKGRGIIMGNVLLARILEYLNGTLFLNDYYRFCVFFIQNYIDFYKLSLEEVSEKSHIMKESILSFLSYLGFHDFDEFQTKLFQDVILRSDQIRSRMLGLKLDDLFEQVHMCDDKEAFMEKLDDLVHVFQGVPALFETVIRDKEQAFLVESECRPGRGVIVHHGVERFVVDAQSLVYLHREFVKLFLCIGIAFDFLFGKDLAGVEFGKKLVELFHAALFQALRQSISLRFRSSYHEHRPIPEMHCPL